VAMPHYAIRGGIEGRERLRVLSRVMRPTTLEFFKRVRIEEGARCLDAGCGGGDVSADLARLVGPSGSVVGIDMDAQKIEIARAEAQAHNLLNVEFRTGELSAAELQEQFDIVYCRFVLTHQQSPLDLLRTFWNCLRPGGKLLVTDIDFDGYFSYPPTGSQLRFVDLYKEAVRRLGGDPCIGPRLASLLIEARFIDVAIHVFQPAGLTGEVKLMAPLTLENMVSTMIEQQLATEEEVNRLVGDLYTFAAAEGTIGSVPRMFDVWGRRPERV
jgi:SAM-dependent methyltransferase